MPSELISIGLSVADYLFLCDELPRGHFGSARDHLMQGGGLAATAAVAMARLGATVEMWSRVGDDLQGRFILEQFRAEGVDTTCVRTCPGARSPACAVTVDRSNGERYFTYFPGRGLDPSPDGLDFSRIDQAKAVLVDCCWLEAQIPAARRARRHGVPVCADVGGVGERTPELLQFVDYPIYSQECARRFAGTGSPEGDLRRLAALGGLAPMITLGAQGCIWLEEGRIRRHLRPRARLERGAQRAIRLRRRSTQVPRTRRAHRHPNPRPDPRLPRTPPLARTRPLISGQARRPPFAPPPAPSYTMGRSRRGRRAPAPP